MYTFPITSPTEKPYISPCILQNFNKLLGFQIPFFSLSPCETHKLLKHYKDQIFIKERLNFLTSGWFIMCLQDTEQVCEGMEKLGCGENPEEEWQQQQPVNLVDTQIQNWGKSLSKCDLGDGNDDSEQIGHLGDSFPVCICLFSLFFVIFLVCLMLVLVGFCLVKVKMKSWCVFCGGWSIWVACCLVYVCVCLC